MSKVEPKATSSPQEPYHQGHDIKSILLNISATLIILTPFLFYFQRDGTASVFQRHVSIWISPYVYPYCTLTGLCTLITFLIPPFGFYRPHVYSDWTWNKPMLVKQSRRKRD